MGAVPFQRAKAALDRNRPTPATSPMILAAESTPHPLEGQHARGEWPHRHGDLPLELVDPHRQLPDATEQLLSDRRHRPIDALQVMFKTRDRPQAPEALRGNLHPREQLVQVPAHTALHAGSLGHQVLAVVHEQADAAGLAVELGDGKARFSKRRPGHRHRLDGVRLAPLPSGAPGRRHQPSGDAHDHFACPQEVGFEPAGQVATVLEREGPLGPA
jgi:hypothetical protein